MEQIHDRVAGLDVHRDEVAVCVRRPGPRGGVQTEKARFSTTTGGLAALASWLAEREVSLAAMEATGVYWKPVYYALEGRFELWLCNAHHVKNVPGRKTDMSDAEWLADVAAHGMVRPSFVPPPAIRELRELTRYRKTQIDVRAAEIARLEKVLQDAGIKLTSVASKVLTQSGRAMIEALIAGQRDPRGAGRAGQGQAAPEDPAADRGAGTATSARITPSSRPASWPTSTSWTRRSPGSTSRSPPGWPRATSQPPGCWRMFPGWSGGASRSSSPRPAPT